VVGRREWLWWLSHLERCSTTTLSDTALYLSQTAPPPVSMQVGWRRSPPPSPPPHAQTNPPSPSLAEVMRFELGDGVLVAGDVTVRLFLFDEEAPVPPAGAELGPGARTVMCGPAAGRQFCFVSLHTAFHPDGDITFPRDQAIHSARRCTMHII
jgi:hypothetical protein